MLSFPSHSAWFLLPPNNTNATNMQECRAKYKNKSRAEQQAQQAAIAAVGRAIAVIDRRRDAAIDAMVARECARALPRIEAAARMAAEKGQGREGLKRARVGEGEAGWSMDGRGGV